MKKQKVNMSVWLCTNPLRGDKIEGGQGQMFPQRFVSQLNKYYPTEGKKVLWMFCGSVRPSKDNDTCDIRKETKATYVCSFKDIPEKKKYDMIIADPPYNAFYAEEWSADLPKPKHIIEKAVKLLKPGGILLLFHIIVTPTYRKKTNFERIGLHPVLCGLGNAIRVVNVLLKEY